jgi:hypothetical protein
MAHEIQYVISERKEVVGGVMTWRDIYGTERTENLRIVWGDVGWALPGGRQTAVKEEALRVAEDIAKALAGYGP